MFGLLVVAGLFFFAFNNSTQKAQESHDYILSLVNSNYDKEDEMMKILSRNIDGIEGYDSYEIGLNDRLGHPSDYPDQEYNLAAISGNNRLGVNYYKLSEKIYLRTTYNLRSRGIMSSSVIESDKEKLKTFQEYDRLQQRLREIHIETGELDESIISQLKEMQAEKDYLIN